MSFNNKTLSAILFVLTALMGAFVLHSIFQRASITIHLSSAEQHGLLQVFWRKPQQEFTENRSEQILVAKSSTLQELKLEIPSSGFTSLRIDPLTKAAKLSIHSLRVDKGLGYTSLSGKQLQEKLIATNQISNISSSDQGLSFSASGNDPQFLLELNESERTSWPLVIRLLSWLLLLGLLFWTVKSTYLQKLRIPITNSFSISPQKIHALIVLMFGFVFALSVTFKLHGSSFHSWFNHYPGLFFESETPLLGKPRGIRSDEWLVHTPGVISQAKRPKEFEISNGSFGASASPMLMGLPNNHFSTFFRPQYWGFFLLELEHAYSWMWSYRILSCLLGVYLMLYTLTRKRVGVSIAGSVWFFSSSFTQWWLSSGVPEMVGNFSLAFAALACLLSTDKRLWILFCVLMLSIFGTSFVLQIYPPFQVPLFWLGISLLLSLFCSKTFRAHFRKIWKFRLLSLAAALALSCCVIISFLVTVEDSARILAQTAYPGVRSEAGGGFSFARYFSGFGALTYSEKDYPESFGNISEGSSFLLTWPLVLALAGWPLLSSRYRPRTTTPILVFILLLSSYLWLGWPTWLAKISLLELVPSSRALIALGLANICFTMMALASFRKLRVSNLIFGFSVLIVMAIVLVLMTEDAYGKFFGAPEHLISISTFLILGFALISKKRHSFALATLIVSLGTGLQVNPVVQGLSPLLQNHVTSAVVALPPSLKSSRWIVFGDFILPALFKTTGVEVFGGAQYVPQLELWRKLDPEGQYIDYYNRYAHFVFRLQSDNLPISIRLQQADLAIVSLAPCAKELQTIGVNVVVLPQNTSGVDLKCLTHFPSALDKQGLAIYVRSTATHSPDALVP